MSVAVVSIIGIASSIIISISIIIIISISVIIIIIVVFMIIMIIMIIIPVKPWFESKDGKTVAKKLGDDLTLECGARGYPLKVEWKFKSETDETVKTCIGKFELDIIRKNFYCLSVSGLVRSLHSISR